MKLSTKGRYAVTALADIAMQHASPDEDAGKLVTLSEISERQDISLAYLEQLFSRLRRAGLVKSVRGPGGGYALAMPASDLRISDIMTAVDERLNAMGVVPEDVPEDASDAYQLTLRLWEQLSAHVHVFLSQTSIADVVRDKMTPCPAVPDFRDMIAAEDEARAARSHSGEQA